MQPRNIIIVGDNAEESAKYFTQLEPVNLNQNVGMAVTSITHGTINNINSENNKVKFYTATSNSRKQEDIIEIEEGYYTTVLNIVKMISTEFKNEFNLNRKRRPRVIKPLQPPRLEIDESELDRNGNGVFTIKPVHMNLLLQKNAPWSIFEKRNFILVEGEELRIKNIDFSQTVNPIFLYSNIVENSYINGKLSRNLSTIPLKMNSGYSHHEFNNPIYVPIDVKQFSKIVIELRDMNGELIKFHPSFKTIINLHIKSINSAA